MEELIDDLRVYQDASQDRTGKYFMRFSNLEVIGGKLLVKISFKHRHIHH